jgi:hypothetical protein
MMVVMMTMMRMRMMMMMMMMMMMINDHGDDDDDHNDVDDDDDGSAARDIATFLARAVVDEILPPSFLSDPLVVGLGGEIVDHAKLLLSRDHMGAR